MAYCISRSFLKVLNLIPSKNIVSNDFFPNSGNKKVSERKYLK
jgi:hypothetical protein